VKDEKQDRRKLCIAATVSKKQFNSHLWSNISNNTFSIYFIGQWRYMLPVVFIVNDIIPKYFLFVCTSSHKY